VASVHANQVIMSTYCPRILMADCLCVTDNHGGGVGELIMLYTKP